MFDDNHFTLELTFKEVNFSPLRSTEVSHIYSRCIQYLHFITLCCCDHLVAWLKRLLFTSPPEPPVLVQPESCDEILVLYFFSFTYYLADLISNTYGMIFLLIVGKLDQ